MTLLLIVYSVIVLYIYIRVRRIHKVSSKKSSRSLRVRFRNDRLDLLAIYKFDLLIYICGN